MSVLKANTIYGMTRGIETEEQVVVQMRGTINITKTLTKMKIIILLFVIIKLNELYGF